MKIVKANKTSCFIMYLKLCKNRKQFIISFHKNIKSLRSVTLQKNKRFNINFIPVHLQDHL